jgi:hypothetical protein
MNVYICTWDITDMRWPCSEWFHVPSTEEWTNVFNVWVSLWIWWNRAWTNIPIYLKLPWYWYRNYNWSSIINDWYCHYWACEPWTNTWYWKEFYSRSDYVFIWRQEFSSTWYFVRWFKNAPVVPDSNWTVLYQGSWDSWIYHNSTLWLISLSSDWTTWYTIQDKNLWATQVYNNWDTMSETNCGKFYQWWNNYWFQFSWTITNISTSIVDITWYWPWNYYSSSTWINNSWYWMNTSNDNRKNLRWWVTWPLKMNELKNAYIGEYIPNFATQWPCAEWFHVPLNTEWLWLKTIMDWLGLTTWDDWRVNLRIPFASRRFGSYADVSTSQIGSFGFYWSSSPCGANYPYKASALGFGSSYFNINLEYQRSHGISIRCFKNSFELPTSSWTVITWTLWWAWIFWNQTEWLISITSDWTTWYTISDKNLWATTVYNNWDTLSEANCGKFYQWWNNYWFAWTWSITTSSTQVDASNYWPWNYYSSSTFITVGPDGSDWSSVQNDNLRWWVDWNVPVE